MRPASHTREARERVSCAVPLGEITNTEPRLRTAIIFSMGLACSCLGILTIKPSGRSHASKKEPPAIPSHSLRRNHPNVCGLPATILGSVFKAFTSTLLTTEREQAAL